MFVRWWSKAVAGIPMTSRLMPSTPDSSSRTLTRGSSESRLARTQPAVPAPTTRRQHQTLDRWRKIVSVTCANLMSQSKRQHKDSVVNNMQLNNISTYQWCSRKQNLFYRWPTIDTEDFPRQERTCTIQQWWGGVCEQTFRRHLKKNKYVMT